MAFKKNAESSCSVFAHELAQTYRQSSRHPLSISSLLRHPLVASALNKRALPHVKLNSRVELLDTQDQQVCHVCVVSSDRAVPDRGRVSSKSPLGRALLGQTIGSTITVKILSKALQFTVLSIQ